MKNSVIEMKDMDRNDEVIEKDNMKDYEEKQK